MKMKTHEAAMILLENMTVGIFILGESGDILFANAEAAEILCTEELPASLHDSLVWIAGEVNARTCSSGALVEPMECRGADGNASLVNFVIRPLRSSRAAEGDKPIALVFIDDTGCGIKG